MVTEQKIWEVLEQVYDPEIPDLSVVDLGMIVGIDILPDENEASKIVVSFTPTFAACPAIAVIQEDMQKKLEEHFPDQEVEVRVSFDQPWNSNRITERGRKILQQRGFAPPPVIEAEIQLDVLQSVQCPYCGSYNTELQTPFGPTLCRAIHYCKNCQQSFEQFKPVV